MSIAYPLQRSPAGFPSPWPRFLAPGSAPRLVRWFLTFVDRCLLQVDTRGLEVRKPIFLLGLDRSALTMLEDLLCRLPEISYITERMSLHPSHLCAVEAIARWLRPGERGTEVVGSSPDEGDALWQRWLGDEPGDFRYVERRIEDFPAERREAMVNDLRKILWCFWPRGGRFFSKHPCLLPHARLLGQLFPDARFVHVLRDPRRTAPEMAKLSRRAQLPRLLRLAEYIEQYGADDIRTTARLWRDGVARMDEVKPQLPSYLEVRFEDILTNPRGSLEDIFDFCKLDASVQQTEFWTRFSCGDTLPTRCQNDDSRLIEQICGDVMQQHGYRRGK